MTSQIRIQTLDFHTTASALWINVAQEHKVLFLRFHIQMPNGSRKRGNAQWPSGFEHSLLRWLLANLEMIDNDFMIEW